ncbi:MAG: NifU family protein [Actinobacteria bacterium]|nr:NifU family protein [Actinomycetota bacterium]
MIAMHPEAVAGDPASVRWVVAQAPAGNGPVTAVPEPLAGLVADGTITALQLLPGAVLVTLGPGRSWRAEGARVRSALHSALEQPQAWRAGSAEVSVEEITAVLAGPAGDVVRAHGGAVWVAGVHAGVVDLELSGACDGCPASGLTISTTLAAAIRRAVPGVVDVRLIESRRPAFVSLGGLLRRGPQEPDA